MLPVGTGTVSQSPAVLPHCCLDLSVETGFYISMNERHSPAESENMDMQFFKLHYLFSCFCLCDTINTLTLKSNKQ